jgi:hypothetical protein
MKEATYTGAKNVPIVAMAAHLPTISARLIFTLI